MECIAALLGKGERERPAGRQVAGGERVTVRRGGVVDRVVVLPRHRGAHEDRDLCRVVELPGHRDRPCGRVRRRGARRQHEPRQDQRAPAASACSPRHPVDADHAVHHVALDVAVVQPRPLYVLAPADLVALSRPDDLGVARRRRPSSSGDRARGRCGSRRRSQARPTGRGRRPWPGTPVCSRRTPSR